MLTFFTCYLAVVFITDLYYLALPHLSVGERRKGNKKFPTRTKTYHGDVHLREGMSDLRTVDVVERPHVPRSAPRTIPRSVPRSSTERTAPPRSAHVQLDDDLGLLDPAREMER